MKHLLLIISGITLGSSALYFWYCEMFSDGFVGWFSRAFNRTRWKNFIALSQPAGGLFFVFGALALVGPMIDPNIFNSRHGHSPFWSYWTAVLVLLSMLFMFIALIGFIPFTLPEWMYPEYHAAKREEQRKQEAAENGAQPDLWFTHAFCDAGRAFAVIDSHTEPVLVPYAGGKELIVEFNDMQFDKQRISKKMNAAQQHMVNLFSYELQKLAKLGGIWRTESGVMALREEYYNEAFGIQTEEQGNAYCMI